MLLTLLAVVVETSFWAFLPLAIALAAERNADVRLGVALADGDAHVNTTNLVGRRVLTLLLFIVIISASSASAITSYGTSAAVAAVIAAVASQRHVRRHVDLAAPRATTSSVLRAARPFYINSVATQARNLDAALVGALVGFSAAGYYGAASRLTGPLRILPTSLAAVILPRSAKAAETASGRYKIVRLTVAVCGAMAVLYALLAVAMPALVPALLGPDYEPAIAAIQITLAGLVFAAAASLLSASLQGWGDAHAVGVIAVVTSVACLGAVALGGLLAGAEGAAVGLSSSFVLQTALLVSRLPHQLRRREP